MDGTAERLLRDDELGWHAANGDINCRNVAICLDNDYGEQDPDPALINQVGCFIVAHYPGVPTGRIFDHREVSKTGTDCPGNNFAGGWKEDLLAAVAHARSDRA